jgi:nucleotide sugar dehydrogenase
MELNMQNTLFDFEIMPSPSTVAVVGLGKIGLPLAVHYAHYGHHVIGCDINPQVVEMVNGGRSPVQEEPGIVTGVAEAVAKGLLSATTNTTEAVRLADVVVVIVPVLIDAECVVNFDAIDAASAAIGSGIRPGTLVIYETTLPVGTTAQRLSRILESTSNLRADCDFYLAHSPERVFSGRILRDLHAYPKIVGGINEKSTAAAIAFYKSVLDVPIISMASTDEAEFVKLIESVYRDVNIALANEFACYADTHNLDVAKAIAAANSQPTSHIHTPGVGVGGHCIPVYPYFLFEDQAKTGLYAQDSECQMLTLPRYARRINDNMAEYAVHRLELLLGPLAHQPVLILGVAYRGGVRETAFTSAKLLQDALIKHGAIVYVDDPLFSESELRALGYTPLPPELEGEICAVILQANHQIYQTFDFRRFSQCQMVLDGRQALSREKIESQGMRYVAIGDGNIDLENLKKQHDELEMVPIER